jgi:phosphatidate cytidylyltransferase
MSDDLWRRGQSSEDDDFGPPLFADDATGEVPTGGSGSLSFGSADTGGLPHWTEPPTGELPRTLNLPVADDTGGTARPADGTDDVDVWSSFSADAPVWSDDPPTGGSELPPPGEPLAGDDSVPAPRREPGRITIGTDPTDDRLGRPMPKSRNRSSRGDDTLGRSRPSGTRPGAPSSRGTPPSSSRDMPTAVAVGLLLAAAFIGAILWEPWAALVVIVAVVGLASVEFFDKVSEKGYHPATVVGIVACTAAPLATYWVGETAIPLVVALAFAAACATFIASAGLESNPMPNIAITMLGIVWIGILGSFGAIILSVSNLGDNPIGTDTLLLLALAVVANDVGALLVGSAIGKTPLRQWISPNKTFEGFIGGTAMTMIAMLVVNALGKSDTWNSWGDLVLLGAVVSIMAPLGDLTESMFKRNLDVKDFGSLVRGHGGVLDRFDGFLFTLPAVYYLMQILEPWASK